MGGLNPVRRFELHRALDITGVSGTGTVAEGTQFSDGTVVVRWRGDHPSTVMWADIHHAQRVHGHAGATTFHWLDPETGGVCGDQHVWRGQLWVCNDVRDHPGPHADSRFNEAEWGP